jgi:hypothetical protein
VTAGLAVKPSSAADVSVFTSGAPADIQRAANLKMLASVREAWKVGGFEPLDAGK